MTKQNLGFIAPFALNILAYVLVYHLFFADNETKPAVENEVPAAFIEEIPETEDGAYIDKEDIQLTAMNDKNR